jgi:uncharacterized protein with HEPN domain
MPRDVRAYLSDVVEACQAINTAIGDMDLIAYSKSRLLRSSIERVFKAISNARRIVDFRNQLTHEYPTVDDELVWAIARTDVPGLKAECTKLLEAAGA